MPQDVNPLLDRLIEAFPACFSRSAPQPLKIGLDEELLARAGVHPALADLSRTPLRRAINGPGKENCEILIGIRSRCTAITSPVSRSNFCSTTASSSPA